MCAKAKSRVSINETHKNKVPDKKTLNLMNFELKMKFFSLPIPPPFSPTVLNFNSYNFTVNIFTLVLPNVHSGCRSRICQIRLFIDLGVITCRIL